VISKSPLERSCFDFRNFSFTRATLITADHLIDRKVRPVQSLTLGLHKSGGRNNTGHITVRHRGGGHKRRYRIADFKRNELFDIPAVVNRLELDPNRKAPIALITYQTGHLSYILAPEGIKAGDVVISSKNASSVPIQPGNVMPIGSLPTGTFAHNVELIPGKGGQIARSAGTSVQILRKDRNYTVCKLKSGEIRQINSNCMATIGSVAHLAHKELGKAGKSRWLGIRPHVRGTAMNPVDHPHGGGQGKTKGGRCSVSPWGRLTKGMKTRSPRKKNRFILRTKRESRQIALRAGKR